MRLPHGEILLYFIISEHDMLSITIIKKIKAVKSFFVM